mgnify:CR=1 FL=1
MRKILLAILLVMGVLIIFEYNGIIRHNEVFAYNYEVKGIDVSHWQNDIKWDQVKQEGIDFAYIKATEGKGFVDDKFLVNWEDADREGIRRGAYHYFTVSSTGSEQAENSISIVPKDANALPPVIDIEVGGVEKDLFLKELNDYIDKVEEAYKKKPILYVMYPLYDGYIKGEFEDYQIWVRDIVKPPKLSDDREWFIWQYSNRGRLNGIQGYVDLNVLNGRLDDFE